MLTVYSIGAPLETAVIDVVGKGVPTLHVMLCVVPPSTLNVGAGLETVSVKVSR